MEHNLITERYKSKYINTDGDSLLTQTPPIPPKNMLLEITNACNYKCIFCYWHPKMAVTRGHIDKQLALRLLKEARDLGVEEVGFSRSGEPFLNPDFDCYTRYAKEIGYKYVYVTTNGSLATPERIKTAVEAGLDSIKFSINALDADTYEKIEGVNKENFKNVVQNLKAIHEYREQNNIPLKIFVSYIMTRYSMVSREDVYSAFANYCDCVLFAGAQSIGGFCPEIEKLLAVKEDVDFFEGREIPCVLPFNSISITKDGYLTGCCDDVQNYLVIADLNKTPLSEAWNCGAFREFRKRHIERDVKGLVCENCAFHTTSIPKPLDGRLAAVIDKENVFSDDYVRNRLQLWEGISY